jgi:GNAT superfamily N-acetyltransferase
VTIRAARPDEVEVLLEVQRVSAVAAFAHVFPQDRYPFPTDAIREAWREALADPLVEVYLAEEDGDAIGSVSIGRGFLRTLYVVPAWWGKGLGSRLHDHGLDRLHAVGAREARLWTLEENSPARRFYEQRGWSLSGRTREVPFPPFPVDVEYVRSLAE